MLVYEEATDANEVKDEDFERNEKWRQQFTANLRKSGVQLEEVDVTSVHWSAKKFITLGLHLYVVMSDMGATYGGHGTPCLGLGT